MTSVLWNTVPFPCSISAQALGYGCRKKFFGTVGTENKFQDNERAIVLLLFEHVRLPAPPPKRQISHGIKLISVPVNLEKFSLVTSYFDRCSGGFVQWPHTVQRDLSPFVQAFSARMLVVVVRVDGDLFSMKMH